MINFKDNTKNLKQDKKALIDTNSIVNEQMKNVINGIKNEIKKISHKHDAEIILSGRIDKFDLKIKSESNESVNIIQDLINKYLK